MNKKFTSKKIPEVIYEIVGEYWLDDSTYVIIFKDMVDADGDTYHLEVEYHKDEKRVTYTRVYDYENVEASQFVSPCFKKQIEEYALQQVGVLTKFKVGDLVVNKFGDVWHIDSFDKKNYQVSNGNNEHSYFPISKQNEMRLWTIQDAKVS